jgi:ferrochelatase
VTVGVLVMAYGSASGPDDVERYYTDIRGGRPPSPEHLAELLERYAAIGNRYPLLDITRAQAAGLERSLNTNGSVRFKTYLGMKHSPPSIPEAVAAMRRDGIERAVGIVMAPHWSAMSIETYVERVEKAVAEGGGPEFTFVRSFHDHPSFVELLASRVGDALARIGSRDGVAVLFSAHSLPVRELEDGSLRCLRCDACPEACRYEAGLRRTADLVAALLGLDAYAIAWQSAGRTTDPWWGPALEEVLAELAASGTKGVVVCSAGFVTDHLEILYDLDVEARGIAERAGMRFERTAMPNAEPRFCEALATVVREHLSGRAT